MHCAGWRAKEFGRCIFIKCFISIWLTKSCLCNGDALTSRFDSYICMMYVFPFSRHLFLSWWALIRLNTTSEFQGTELTNYSGRRWGRINAPLQTLVTLKWWNTLEIGDFECTSLELCDVKWIHHSDTQWQQIAASSGVRYHWIGELFWRILWQWIDDLFWSCNDESFWS